MTKVQQTFNFQYNRGTTTCPLCRKKDAVLFADIRVPGDPPVYKAPVWTHCFDCGYSGYYQAMAPHIVAAESRYKRFMDYFRIWNENFRNGGGPSELLNPLGVSCRRTDTNRTGFFAAFMGSCRMQDLRSAYVDCGISSIGQFQPSASKADPSVLVVPVWAYPGYLTGMTMLQSGRPWTTQYFKSRICAPNRRHYCILRLVKAATVLEYPTLADGFRYGADTALLEHRASVICPAPSKPTGIGEVLQDHPLPAHGLLAIGPVLT